MKLENLTRQIPAGKNFRNLKGSRITMKLNVYTTAAGLHRSVHNRATGSNEHLHESLSEAQSQLRKTGACRERSGLVN
jgi:hypothetical protein